MRPRTPSLLLAALLAAGPALAQPSAPAPNGALAPRDVTAHPRVRQAIALATTWLEAQRAYDEIPGVSAAVVHDQTVLWSGGFGMADPARRAPATAGTVYSICSISKLFTSVAVMQLRDAGRLRLDDPVRQHLPWFELKPAGPDAPEVTIEGLLTHAAGIPRESNHPYWSGPDFRFPTHDEIVAGLRDQEALMPPWSRFQYSNLGLTLAGEIVAAKGGMPYGDYVRRHILDPLGLTSTTTEMPERERGGRLAVGHSAKTRAGTREPVPFFSTRGIAPAAGYASTADDLARFATWQLRVLGGKGGAEVLRANTLREMQRVHFMDPEWQTSWGLGFAVWRDQDKTFVGHGGSCPGYRSQLLLRPEDKIATVFMANAGGVNTGGFAQRLYDIVAPAVAAAVRDSAGRMQADTSLAKYLGTYESQPWSGETAVVAWEDGLAVLGLPTMDPVRGLTRLRRVPGEPHTFRRVRRDGTLAEPIRFEIGPDGRAVRYWQHQNPSERIR